MNTKPSGVSVLRFWGCLGTLACLAGCGGGSGSGSSGQQSISPLAATASAQSQQTTAPFSPQEAQLLIQQVRTGEKKVADLTPRERFILGAILQADKDRRHKNHG